MPTDLRRGRAARYAWALLLARIYAVFPLRCPRCGADMPSITCITDTPTVRNILARLGEPTVPPRIAPAPGRPLWEAADTALLDSTPPGESSAQPELAYEFDQRRRFDGAVGYRHPARFPRSGRRRARRGSEPHQYSLLLPGAEWFRLSTTATERNP